MKINKKNALKLWDEIYGKTTQTSYDFAQRKINKSEYNTNSKNSWNIDHIFPLNLGGTDSKNNLQIVHYLTNNEKGDKVSFVANNSIFNVVKEKNGIYKIKEKNKYVENLNEYKNLFEEYIKFDKHTKNWYDFAGRKVEFNEFQTKSNESWDVDFFDYNNSNQRYVANSLTIKERANKTSFSCNDLNFQTIRFNDKYYFVNTDDFYSLDNKMNVFFNINKSINENREMFFDILTIKIRYNYYYYHYSDEKKWINNIVIEFNKIIKAFENDIEKKLLYNFNILKKNNELILNFIFNTPEINDVSYVHEIALYFNTIKLIFTNKFDLKIDIAHWSKTIKNSDLWNFLNSLNLYTSYSIINNDYFSQLFNKMNSTSLIVSSEVFKYLIECNYKENTFEEKFSINNEVWYQRNYIFDKLKKIIDSKWN
ncbi:HNH endonuclease [Mycoplasmopsis cricetuli]|uniref:HNH endonuclease n=1 Tax=Mycoplasmopsis cricetuli TaxID=171283 RepID=UPI000471302C|nr:HNH endonuclease signature motif containing protein [Mycoplasmopsis cricetuli]